MEDYTHHALGEEVQFVAGHYEIVEEGRLTHGGKEFLYLLGIATVDNSCCGRTGCQFLFIPGYLHSWKVRTDAQGRAVSEVEPISDQQNQSVIRAFLKVRHPYAQINFFKG